MAVLITGTSRGIGKALVEEYLKEGDKVIAITRGKGVDRRVKGNHCEIAFNWEDYERLSEEIRLQLDSWDEKLDSVINNAGLLYVSSILDVTYEEFEEQMRVNVWLVVELFKTLYKGGHLGEQAHVVSIGSMGGVQGAEKFPGLFSYSASKAALAGLTESLDAEFGADGLSFNCLALGAVNTEMLKEAFPGYISHVNPKNMARFARSFTEGSGRLMSGKIIQVSKTNPRT